MKHSNTALKELKKRYKNILIKCAMLNAATLISFTGMAHADVITAAGIETGTVTNFILTYNNKYSGAVYALGGGDVSSFSLSTNTINFQDSNSTNARPILARLGGSVYLGGENTSSITIVSDNYSMMSVGNAAGDTSFISLNGKDISVTSTANSSVYTDYGSKVEIEGNNVSINAAKYGVQALDNKSLISLKGDNISITAHTYDYASSLYAGLGGSISVIGKNITLTSDQTGITNLSGAQTNIEGNLTINAPQAIVTRGKTSILSINETSNYTSKINGNISFEYDKTTSGDLIDATVNLTLNGADSYWNGNIRKTWSTDIDEEQKDELLKIEKGVSLTLNNGASWTATAIEENQATEQVAVTSLTVNKGTIHSEGGHAHVKNATISGDLTLNGTLTTVSGGTVTFKEGSTLTTTLDDSTVKFDGNGKVAGTINLTSISKEGTFAFAQETVDVSTLSFTNALYDIIWADDSQTDITISKKASEKVISEIAQQTNADTQTAAAVVALANANETATAEGKLISSLISEAVQSGHAETAVNEAKKAAPSTAPVATGLAKEAAGSIAKISSARLDGVKGRSGGDSLKGTGLWLQGIYNHTKQDATSSSDGFKADSKGFALGVDREITDTVILGAGYGYMQTDADSFGRDLDVDGHNFFIYGKYQPSQWYVSSVLNYNYSKYKEKKHPFGITLRSDYDVSSYGGQIMTGYDLKNGLTPEAGVRYLVVDADSYYDGMQRVSSDTDDVLTLVAGLKYETKVNSNGVLFKPTARFAVTYDAVSDNSKANVSVLGGSNYSIEGERLHRLGVEAGLGVTASIQNLDLTLEYNGAFRQDYRSQGGMIKAKYNF